MASCEVAIMNNYKEAETFEKGIEQNNDDVIPTSTDQEENHDEHGDGEGGIEYYVVSVDDEDVCNFDQRMSQLKENGRSTRTNCGDSEEELLKINRIFREVAQALGVEWITVFTDLMKPLKSSDEIESELKTLEVLRPLVRGYKALHNWRNAAGEEFSLEKLEQSLVKNNHTDISSILHQNFNPEGQNDVESRKKLRNSISRRKSDVTVINSDEVDNRHLLLLSKSIGEDWIPLAKELNFDAAELEEIISTNSTPQEKAFKMLWSWRETSNKQLGKLQLNGCLGSIKRDELALS